MVIHQVANAVLVVLKLLCDCQTVMNYIAVVTFVQKHDIEHNMLVVHQAMHQLLIGITSRHMIMTNNLRTTIVFAENTVNQNKPDVSALLQLPS